MSFPLKESSDFARVFHVTLVDIEGALFPGLVWLVLLVTLALGVQSPIQGVGWLLCTGHADLAFCIAVGLGSLLLGWTVKASGFPLADVLCSIVVWCRLRLVRVWEGLTGLRQAPGRARVDSEPDGAHEKAKLPKLRALLFPYNWQLGLEHPEAFRAVSQFANALLRQDCADLPGYQPFETCKLALRTDDSCREEVVRLEATVSALASLFLASVFSLGCALYERRFRGDPDGWTWAGWSLGLALLLGYSHHSGRLWEVKRIYGMALLVASRERGGDPNIEGRPASSGR
jgi:hypothetical protein